MHRPYLGIGLLSGAALAAAACSTVQYRTDYDREAEFVSYETYDWMLPTEAEQTALARISPFLERRLQRALDRELTERGYTRSTDGSPDVWVSAYPILADADESGADYTSSGYGGGILPGVSLSVGLAVAPYGAAYGPAPYGYGYGPYGSAWFSPYPYFGYPAYGYYPSIGVGYYSAGGYGYAPYGGAYGYPLAVTAGANTPGTLAVDVTDARSDLLVWRGWAEGALYEPVSSDELADFVDEVVQKIMRGFPPPGES